MAKISLLASEGCLSSNISMVYDSLGIADLWHQRFTNSGKPLCEVEILTSDGKPVTGYGGIPIHPHRAMTDVDKTDFLVVAPFLPNVVPMPEDICDIKPWVENLREAKTPVATVCTGTFMLAEMGLLSGRTATTNWQFTRMFKRAYPDVNLKPERMLTDDDGIICTGAATAGYHLMLYIVQKFGSEKLASVCAKTFLVDPARDSQAPYMISMPVRTHGDDQVLKAQNMIEEKYPAIESVDELAKEAGISPRHFKRRFKQATGELPLKYLQRTRIDAARELLEMTRDTIDDITWAVGYQDVSSFCRLFKQSTALSPKAYRDKFFCGQQVHTV